MLAIVIPYYTIDFFEDTLQSLKNQTDRRFTVYIGNDGSLKNPIDLIEKFKNEINISYKAFDKNIGQHSLVSHWDRCLDLVKDEEWLWLLGDDDQLEENCVSQFFDHLNKIERQKSNVVQFASQIIYTNRSLPSVNQKNTALELASESFYSVFKKEKRSSLSEYVFKRNSYDKYGFQEFPLAWFSDTMAWLDFSENRPIYAINEAAVLVRVSDSSISGKIDNMEQKYKASFLFYQQLIQKHFKKFSKIQKEELFEEYCNYVYVTKSFNFESWRMIVWNAIKKLDLNTIKKITKRTINNF